MVFKGNTSGSILQVAYNIPAEIISFSLVNKTGGAVTVTVYIRDEDGVDTAITSLALSLAAGASYISEAKIKLQSYTSIYIVASGSLDYYFSIN